MPVRANWIHINKFSVIPSSAQILFMILCLGIIPGRLKRPFGVLGINPGLAECKVNILPALLPITVAPKWMNLEVILWNEIIQEVEDNWIIVLI